VNDDVLLERDESFVLELSSPTGAVLGRARATGTIVDDEAALLRGLFG
jgi:hypothetical protein